MITAMSAGSTIATRGGPLLPNLMEGRCQSCSAVHVCDPLNQCNFAFSFGSVSVHRGAAAGSPPVAWGFGSWSRDPHDICGMRWMAGNAIVIQGGWLEDAIHACPSVRARISAGAASRCICVTAIACGLAELDHSPLRNLPVSIPLAANRS